MIRPGFLALIERSTAFGPWRVYRAVNGTRFGTAKGPYKTFMGAVAERADGVGAFVTVDAQVLLVGTGMPQPAPYQLPLLREGIAGTDGEDFEAAVAATRETGGSVHGGRWDPLKRVPTPYPPTHPRADYLRWKGFEINVRDGGPDQLDRLWKWVLRCTTG